MRAEDIHIETDEDGFHLRIQVIDGEADPELDFLILDPEEFYKRVRWAIEPWLREQKDARRARAFSSVPELKQAIRDGIEDADGGIMRQEIDDLNRHAREEEIRAEAYELNDPEHPTYHERMSDAADLT